MPDQENLTAIVIREFFRKGRENGKPAIISAVEWIQELLAVLKPQGYQFKDVLMAISRYTAIEGEEDYDKNPKWLSVSKHLELAASAFTPLIEEVALTRLLPNTDHSSSLQDLFRSKTESYRQAALLSLIKENMIGMESADVKVSELLIGLSLFAGLQATQAKAGADKPWSVARYLLHLAAQDAEQPGLELT